MKNSAENIDFCRCVVIVFTIAYFVRFRTQTYFPYKEIFATER